MKLQIIPMQMGAIVKTLILLGLLFSCKSNKAPIEKRDQAYVLINTIGYGNDILNNTTLSYNDLSQKDLFTLNEINDRNYKNNWAIENEPFVNFDTIFNSTQEHQINEKFKKLKNVSLNRSKLKNQNILSKNGQTYITYPFFQESENGQLYAFFYQLASPESILFIFIKTKEGWKEFAKVAMGIS